MSLQILNVACLVSPATSSRLSLAIYICPIDTEMTDIGVPTTRITRNKEPASKGETKVAMMTTGKCSPPLLAISARTEYFGNLRVYFLKVRCKEVTSTSKN